MQKRAKIYCFIAKFANRFLSEGQRQKLVSQIVNSPHQQAILLMVRNSYRPLNQHMIAWILDLPAHHVYHNLMLLRGQFLIAKDVRENWFSLNLKERKRQKRITELSGLLELYSGMGHSLLHQEFGSYTLLNLNHQEVEKFRRKFLKGIENLEKIAS